MAPGSEEFRERTARTLRRMPWLGRVFRVDYARGSELRDDQWKHLEQEIAVVRIDLTP